MRYLSFVPLAISMVLFNCSNSSPVDVPQADGGAIPATGAVGSSCGDRADCESNACYMDPPFTDGYCVQDCGEGDSCPAGSTCYPAYGFRWCLDQCANDTECRSGYVCEYGVCRPPCENADTCAAGDRCDNGRCKGPCQISEDCGDAMRCQDGKCLPPCLGNGDCLPGHYCDLPTSECIALAGAQMGESCVNEQDCATQYCMPGRKICSAKCKGTSDCPTNFVCGLEKYDQDSSGTLDSVLTACIPIAGNGEVGSNCGADADCRGNHCYNGFCIEACAAAENCTPNLLCSEVSVIMPGGIPKATGCLPAMGTSKMTLGTYNAGDLFGVDVPAHATSFLLHTEIGDASEVGLVSELIDPKGDTLLVSSDACDFYSQPIRYYYEEEISTLYVPNTTGVKLNTGVHTVRLAASKLGLPITVSIQMKLGLAQKGTLNINWVFLNLSGTCIPGSTLSASTAANHSWLAKVRSNMAVILQSAGLTIGTETYSDLPAPSLDVIDIDENGGNSELSQLFTTSKSITGNGINIYFVRQITSNSTGGVVLGISGGIPGPVSIHGTSHSGIAMSMQTACFEQWGYNPGHTLAHEVGHFLGLFHNQESQYNPGYNQDGQEVLCGCPCKGNMTCEYNAVASWCRGQDHIPDTNTSDKNLMYWAAENTQLFEGNELSSGQVRTILNNPIVGH
jgi:hypothetical protein